MTEVAEIAAADAGEGASSPGEVTERLLDAAVEVFAQRGFEAARVAEIARRAGLTTGAIYARWTGKREMIVDAVGYSVARCVLAPETLAAMPDEELLAALVADLGSSDRARVREVMLEAFVSARRDGSFRSAVSEAVSEDAARLSAIVARGKAGGCIDPALDTGAIVALYQSLGLGMHLAASVGTDGPRPQAAHWDALVSRLVAALRPPGG